MNSYNYYITDYPQYFHNAEHDINCILGFFQDASFAGNLQESRSNLCISVIGHENSFHGSARNTPQFLHNSTETYSMSLDVGLNVLLVYSRLTRRTTFATFNLLLSEPTLILTQLFIPLIMGQQTF